MIKPIPRRKTIHAENWVATNVQTNADIGFRGVLFENPDTHERVIAYARTKKETFWLDGISDTHIALKEIPLQYKDAPDFYEVYKPD